MSAFLAGLAVVGGAMTIGFILDYLLGMAANHWLHWPSDMETGAIVLLVAFVLFLSGLAAYVILSAIGSAILGRIG